MLGSGTPLREFLHVDDLGDASICTTLKPASGSPSIMNVGTGTDVSIKDLAEAVASIIKFSGKLWDTTKPDGTYKKQLNVSRLSELGWNAKITLEEGLITTILDYQRALVQKSARL